MTTVTIPFVVIPPKAPGDTGLHRVVHAETAPATGSMSVPERAASPVPASTVPSMHCVWLNAQGVLRTAVIKAFVIDESTVQNFPTTYGQTPDSQSLQSTCVNEIRTLSSFFPNPAATTTPTPTTTSTAPPA